MRRPTITFRLSQQMSDAVRSYTQDRQRNDKRKPDYTVSDFVVQAVKEKLAHSRRNQKQREKIRTRKTVDGGQELIEAARRQIEVDKAEFPRHLEG
jgi:hypothetical protein